MTRVVIAAACLSSWASFAAEPASVPQGWFFAGAHPGAYESNVGEGACNARSLRLHSISTDLTGKHGSVMQLFRADRYRGQRVRFSGVTSSTDVRQSAGLWMRVDGADKKTLAFDNMQTRPLLGSTPCARNAVVLDVPDEAEFLALGVVVEGEGQVELSDIAFEVVDQSVATTDVMHPRVSVSQDRPGSLGSGYGVLDAVPLTKGQSFRFTAQVLDGRVEVKGTHDVGSFTVSREQGVATIEGTWGTAAGSKPARIVASARQVDMVWGGLERHLKAYDEPHAAPGCRYYRENEFDLADTMRVCGEAFTAPVTNELRIDLVAQFLSSGFAPARFAANTRSGRAAPRDPPPQVVHGQQNLGWQIR